MAQDRVVVKYHGPFLVHGRSQELFGEFAYLNFGKK